MIEILVCYNRRGDNMEIIKTTLGQIKSNCYIVHENGHALVIDPGYESEEIPNYIKKHQLILDGIYITHGHYDHVGGVKQLKDMFKCLVYAPIKDKIWLKIGPYNQIGYEIPVDIWVKDLDVYSFIDKQFTVYETPGHSEGGTVLSCEDTLFSGDTLFFQSVGITHIPFADAQTLYKSIKRLYQLFDDHVIVYPGHGKQTTIGHEKRFNPFVKQ
jgi:hydroxyacylglutathione hydrolase